MNPLIQLISNPAIISMTVGFIIGLYQLLEIPASLSNLISLYLIFAIGLKGGMCLGVTNACTPPLLGLIVVGIIIGFIQPFINFFILKKTVKLDIDTMAVLASEYGSISIVTFVTAITFLKQYGVAYDTFMSAIAGTMEIPAIFTGLILLQKSKQTKHSLIKTSLDICYKIVCSKKISFIFIGFFTGFIFRAYSTHPITQWVLWPFTLALIVFMIDVGIKIAKQRTYIYEFDWKLIAFGIYMPIIAGNIGVFISALMGVGLGSTLLFGVLVGSASYIAVPAIMSSQAPEAKKAIYLPMSLGITLAFNLVCGIPLFFWVARHLIS